LVKDESITVPAGRAASYSIATGCSPCPLMAFISLARCCSRSQKVLETITPGYGRGGKVCRRSSQIPRPHLVPSRLGFAGDAAGPRRNITECGSPRGIPGLPALVQEPGSTRNFASTGNGLSSGSCPSEAADALCTRCKRSRGCMRRSCRAPGHLGGLLSERSQASRTTPHRS
jgi:hypothetical protein